MVKKIKTSAIERIVVYQKTHGNKKEYQAGNLRKKTGVDFFALTGCEHGNCLAEQRAERNLVLHYRIDDRERDDNLLVCFMV